MKMKKVMMLAAIFFAAFTIVNAKQDTPVPDANAHWNFEIEVYSTEVVQETSVSGKFTMNVNCDGVLKGFEVLNGTYVATPLNQVEALLNSDVSGEYKGATLRIVSSALVNLSTGLYEIQTISITYTDKKGNVYETYNLQAEGSFTPYDFTFQSLVTLATGTFAK
jgi:hypothetical protein